MITRSMPTPPLLAHEILALCDRLAARAESKMMEQSPEQSSDLRTAARLLRESLSDLKG